MDLTNVACGCGLIALSIILLPLSTSILIFSYLAVLILPRHKLRRTLAPSTSAAPYTILVTGASTSSGLHLSRAFFAAGHKVIGADFEPERVPVHARFSNVFFRFYPLRQPNGHFGPRLYFKDLITIVQKEKANLWINCSGVVSPSEDAQARRLLEEKTACRCFAVGDDQASSLSSKSEFLSFTAALGLPVPETHQVQSRADIHNVLNKAKGKKTYLLGNGVVGPSRRAMMLPRRTLSQTYQHVASIKISKEMPLILEQQLEGPEAYSTFSVIVQGRLRVFAAASMSDSGYQSVSTASGLGRAMLSYVGAFAERAGEQLTVQLSIEFRVQEKSTEMGTEKLILPVGSNMQIHPVSLFLSSGEDLLALSNAYMASLTTSTNGVNHDDKEMNESTRIITTSAASTFGIYFMGPTILSLLFSPLFQLVTLKLGITDFVRSCLIFAKHLLFWRDGIYQLSDPLPVWYLYQIYIPLRLLMGTRSWRNSDKVDLLSLVG